MQIRNLFQKDIFRPINGVVKADQLDDLSVWQELDEYVVTKELDRHLREFFSSYLDSIDSAGDPDVAGKVGVWVSGFFGSGKSHFIKILSYLLNNKTASSNGTTKQPVEFFDEKIEDPMLLADIKRAIGTNADVILFNIDSKADSRDRDAILSVFLKVFNEMLGYCGDHPHIADMERYLTRKGKLDQFHLAFQKVTGSRWIEERDAYQFKLDELAEALSQTLGESRESLSKWLDNPEANFPLTVENFARWVKEYLESKGEDRRIIFLVDEVGQFIGQDTALMLSLQTITENLGTVCGGRAWVVVTSQEDTLAETGNYPGGDEITDGLALIGKLLSEHEGFEFIDRFIALKDDLLALSEHVHDLDHFHQSQRPTWEKLRRAFEGFQPNRKELEKDGDAHAALNRMREILNAPAPYKLISEADKLIKTVEKINNAAIEKRREHALEQIDARIAEIKKELDAAKAEPDLRNVCLHPLQTIRKWVGEETSISNIFMAPHEAIDAHDEAMDRIEAFLREKAKEEGKPGKGEEAPAKARRVVKPVELVKKPYLESQEDVEEFLEELREQLEAAIKNNERIQIR